MSDAKDGRMHRVRIRRDRLVFRDMGSDDLRFTDLTSAAPTLFVRCDVPDTMIVAMKGMPLRQVVDHPAFDGMTDVKVAGVSRTMHPGGPGLSLRFNRIVVPLIEQEPLP